ncbi:hypothetical protein CLAFUW4_11169 [Fulvia fulva]|uniref:Putative effector 52 n=1 Tax=Passalora fulva TaxID=5499 RepID=A0A1P8YY29_PASFU|nr:uncharacterized protein CLAFUR5_14670 [Fulvia fulva]AQA29255.1 putative effector 52 [Fulvia fulva]KAK4619904.1 hypothetical protein CLAFUR4_11174 [Fulvia fulva]KAK4620417.1 hypothetical protein CLAFUR0_11179 [Fulvia fulva]UJO19793.1 hypothetical protein CLAFUR5_14670 [Fulvia fulva]WPV17322.1 hypothetical protein CLAFUW4_11169 [Fulvia fulva]
MKSFAFSLLALLAGSQVSWALGGTCLMAPAAGTKWGLCQYQNAVLYCRETNGCSSDGAACQWVNEPSAICT